MSTVIHAYTVLVVKRANTHNGYANTIARTFQ